jgi:hypothetical protein
MRIAAVEGFDAGLHKGLSCALVGHLQQLKEPASSVPMRLAKATDATFTELPPGLLNAFPQAGIVAGLAVVVERMVPSRVRLVALTARPPDRFCGLGVTVALQDRGGQAVREITVWESDFGLLEGVPDPASGDGDGPGRYQRLMLPAAVWLAYQKELGFDSTKPRPLNTGKWRSYAHFATGEAAHGRGRYRTAESQYLLALDHDKSNEGARLNFGSLLLSPKPAESDEQRDARLHIAIKLLKPLTPGLEEDDTPGRFWYRARYLMAVAHLDAKEFESAHEVLDALDLALAEEKGGPAGQRRRQLTRPLAASLRACVRLEQGELDVPEPLPDPDWETGDGYFNLACFCARKHDKVVESVPKAQLKSQALGYLAGALARGDELLRRYARTHPAFQGLYDDDEFRKLVAEPEAPDQEGVPLGR